MRFLGRLIGWILFLAGLTALAGDLLLLVQEGAFRLRPLGEIWFSIDPPSLNLLQAVTERYLAVWLWDFVLFPILQAPAALVLGLPGLLLLILCRERRSRRIFAK